ncbi:DUF2586 family protein [Chryseobacterium salviniae]|uniref:DUF2586 family protein n=1 Tax=Chryseobacterium salviniae TaxID=3101750 RepID=A0ABU6HTY3_9FLAO|nr:DUF2586 family protein [Chryseobacterium sp. T9W2-O]MEC3875937.1 DUF2586 family protein [Chryseobacterium sp. T9W2-O]
MGLPNISFIIATSGLGLLTADIQKVPGLVITGNTVADKITIGESKQIFSLQDAENNGITVADNPFAYKHVKAFYDYAGTNAELWIMLASDATTMSAMADKTGNIAKKLINDAGGRIRVLGLIKESEGTETTANGLDADVDLAAVKLQALADEFTGKYFPFRGIISGNNFTGTVADLKDYTTTTHNRVSILLANTDGEKEASIGLALGRLASIPVQRKLHKVRDGAVENFNAYFTNGEKVESLTSSWDTIADKNYIFLRNFVGKAGFYFTSDPTLTGDSDDFNTLSNGFVMDKAIIIAYNVLVENLGDEIPVTDSGTIHPAIIKSWQTAVESNINGNMTNLGELSNCRCYIDETHDVLNTGTMEVEIQLLPVGYAEFITVKIGFTTSIQS